MEEKKTRVEENELNNVSGGNTAFGYAADYQFGVDVNACVGCGYCADNCPMGCITIEDRTARIDSGSCIHCYYCHGLCPTEAIDPDRLYH